MAAGLLAVAGPAGAGTTTGFAFLNLPAGARAAALGGSYTAIADDPNALFWNPAGVAPATPLTTPNAGVVSAMHHESIQSFRQDVVGGVWQKRGDGLSLGFNAHYTGSIEQTDELGTVLGTTGASDFAIAGGWATTAAAGLRLGAGLQWVSETLAGTSASALSLSAGGLYAPAAVTGLTLGLAVRNIGGSPAFTDEQGGKGEKVEQPLTLAGGAAYTHTTGSVRWLVTGEATKLKGDSVEGRLGVEVLPAPVLALRAGWMLGQDAADLTAGAGVTFGRVSFDYAYVPYHDDLGSSHRAGLTARL
jgi:hypothetical protein